MNSTRALEMLNLLGQSGALFENEKRVAFGMAPLPELNGVRLQSLNYIDTKIAKQYQTKSLSEGGENGDKSI